MSGNLTALQAQVKAAEAAVAASDLGLVQAFQAACGTDPAGSTIPWAADLVALPDQLGNAQLVQGAKGLIGLWTAFQTNLARMVAIAKEATQ